MLKQLREGHDRIPIRDMLRPAYFVPETKRLDDLLREIRQRRVHMVIVVDEYSSVAGLVTIEDLVEEIVGDIKDEFDREENLYEQVGPDEYIFDAKISINDFNDITDMHLDDAYYDTLGGFLYAQLDKIPVAGDITTFNDTTFKVLATRGRRITKVQVVRHQGQVKLPQRVAEEQTGQEQAQAQPQLPAPPAPAQEQRPQSGDLSSEHSSHSGLSRGA